MGKENPQPRIAHDGLLRANWQTAKRLIVPTFAGTLAIIGAACSSGTEKGISASEHAPLDLSSSSATPTPKSTETQKPAVEKKVSLSKKPEDLFHALLTTPVLQSELPEGIILKGKSVGNLNETTKALKAIGIINILFLENDPKLYGTSGVISYTIFPNASGAKDAYNIFSPQFSNTRVLEYFPYPTTIGIEPFLGSSSFTTVVITSIENVMAVATFIGLDPNAQEEKTIAIARAGLEHLIKVGR